MNIPEAINRAKSLAKQLQAAAFSEGYEDAHPSNAWTRQDRTAAVSRAKLDELLAAIDALAAAPPAPAAQASEPVAHLLVGSDWGEELQDWEINACSPGARTRQ